MVLQDQQLFRLLNILCIYFSRAESSLDQFPCPHCIACSIPLSTSHCKFNFPVHTALQVRFPCSHCIASSIPLSTLHCKFDSAGLKLSKPHPEPVLAKLHWVWCGRGNWTKTGSESILRPQCGHGPKWQSEEGSQLYISMGTLAMHSTTYSTCLTLVYIVGSLIHKTQAAHASTKNKSTHRKNKLLENTKEWEHNDPGGRLGGERGHGKLKLETCGEPWCLRSIHWLFLPLILFWHMGT